MRKAKLPQAPKLRTALRQLPLLATLLLILPLLASCGDDELKMTYYLTMTDDVLEYVDPTVIYSTPSDGTETLTLTRDLFLGGEIDITDEIGSTEGIVDPKNFLLWYKSLEYNNTNVTTTMSVTFRLIKEIPDDGREFNYLASLGYWYKIKQEGGLFGGSSLETSNGSLPDFESEKIGREEFVRRINQLIDRGLTVSMKFSD